MDELSSAEDLNESLIEAANGFCWNVREQFELDIDIKTIPADGPILLSFHRGCQPIVRRLNNLLQSAGYKTLLGLGDGKYPGESYLGCFDERTSHRTPFQLEILCSKR